MQTDFSILAQQAQAGPNDMFKTIAIFAIFYGILYILFMRPQKKKQAEHKQMVAALKKDDRVILEGGIYGAVHAVEEGVLKVEIAEKTIVKIDQNAVRVVLGDEKAVEATK
jgi:preprotein translocase subunit YajC